MLNRRRYFNTIFRLRRLKYLQSKHYKNIILLFLWEQIRNKVGRHWLPLLNSTIINVFQKKLKRMNDSLSNILGFGACWHDVVDYGVTLWKRLKTRLKRLKCWVELKFDLKLIKSRSISINISANTNLTPCISSFSVAPRDSACDISSQTTNQLLQLLHLWFQTSEPSSILVR